MAVRVERSLHRYIEENKEFLIQVQMSSDLEAATGALRLAAEDVAALDGGWESAFGLSPGDSNGPTGVGVQVAPHGPVLGVDGGHTPDELLATIPSLIVRRLQEAGVTKAVLARPKQSETLVHVRTMPHAVVLHVFAAPLIPYYDQTSANDAKPSDRLLTAACTWLTAGVGADHELWGLVAPLMELSVQAAHATAFLGEHGGLLVAGRPPSPVPSERAKAERWDEEQRRLDSIERIGGRIRCATTGNRSLTLAFGGPEASEHDLIEAVHELREVARRLAPHTVYAFVTCEPTFEVVATSSLHYLWSQEAPQSCPTDICDEVVFDGFHSQVLGPGHIRRLGAVPPGAEALEDGRIEVVIGEARSWLPIVREQGRALLAPCLLGSRGEVERLMHQRFQGTSGDPEADGVAVRRALRSYGLRPVPPLEELLTDPKRLFTFRLAARRRVLGNEAPEPALLTGRRPISPFATHLTSELRRLQRPLALHLHPPPPLTIDGLSPLPLSVLEPAGRWLVAEAEEVTVIVDEKAYRVPADDAVELLATWTEAAPAMSLATTSPDGVTRTVLAKADDNLFVPGVTLTAGRVPEHAHAIGAPIAAEETLAIFDALTYLARSVAPDLGYAYVTIHNGLVRYERAERAEAVSLCDELVVDVFPFQILGAGHLQRLGGSLPGARSLPGGKLELTVGDARDWLLGVKDRARDLLAPCLVTHDEAAALTRARRASAKTV